MILGSSSKAFNPLSIIINNRVLFYSKSVIIHITSGVECIVADNFITFFYKTNKQRLKRNN